MPLPLFALFLAAFCIGTAEFVIAGILPEVSQDLAVSIPQAGMLITAYAIGVAIGGPIVTMLIGGISRKVAVVSIIAVFTVGQVLCALAPSYELLMASRLLVSIGHGAFFGAAAILATRLVPPEKAGRAVGLLLAGLTVANILGVPGGTAIGQAFGWRATFWAVGACGLVALAATAFLLPHDKPQPSSGRILRELGALTRPAVWMTFLTIVVAIIGQFALFTYIAPYLTEVSGIPASFVPWILLLSGLGSTVGVLAGGRLADWKLMPSLIGMLIALAVVFALMWFFGSNAIVIAVLIVIWSGLSFGFGTPAQTRVLKAAADAPNLVSSLVPSAFNVAIAAGSWAGAVALEGGWGYQSLPLIGVVVSLAGAAIATLSWRIEERALAAA
jgi:MFS transporter, DHA1 family, inner membrane transport protein